MSLSPSTDSRERIRRSALWAAYGDALGFITEGVDAAGVRRRAGGPRVEKTVPWKRRIGGKFGPTVPLPAGCISDDTQLRLATSRSIRQHAAFDVETFAKIELTVWPSYALGAGKGSLEAAANLRRRDVTWATNFFAADRASYLNGGGNGGAMRIQPHVWAHSCQPDRRRLIADVVTNTVATHGHLRGILGAVFHALCLLHAFEHGEVPGPTVWNQVAAELSEVGPIAESDEVLSELWLGQWEARSENRFADEVRAVTKEVKEDLERLGDIHSEGVSAYGEAVEALEAFRQEQRGSGTKTAILAAVAAFEFGNRPLDAVVTVANRPGTDTDTVATMAGAIVGAVAHSEPEGEIADRDYILHEADRMWAVSEGAKVAPFQYPNLLTWSAPRSASDCVAITGDDVEVAGLGPARPDSEEFATSGKTPGVWQWLGLWFGQRVLIKRRPRPKALPSSQRVAPVQQYLDIPSAEKVSAPEPSDAPAPDAARDVSANESDGVPSLHELTSRVIASDFDPEVVGAALLSLADRRDGVELSVAYVAIITKARMSRLDRSRRRSDA